MLSNITSINLDLQTGGAALVAKQINALVSPARRIYVFGGATDAFPYFSTFANALTYANSLTPSTTNPVSIVLLSKSDNTPVTITGNDDWYALCLDGIYVSSPYREIFSTTTLPTTLPKGMRVMYEDANGVESLWVGNADGNAWPAVGYKQWSAIIDISGSTVSSSVKIDTIGGLSASASNSLLTISGVGASMNATASISALDAEVSATGTLFYGAFYDNVAGNVRGGGYSQNLDEYTTSAFLIDIRIYP